MIKIAHANIVSAFSRNTVGTKVTDPDLFLDLLNHAVERTDFKDQRVAGQAFIPLNDAIDHVSGGVGVRTSNPEDYVVRNYRDSVSLFLRREFAEPVETLSVVVYTREAYLADPDVMTDPKEGKRIGDATHVLVAVLAASGPRSPLSPGRLVSNLAGGNKEALVWSGDEIREKAREASEYHNNYCTVAD